MMTSDDDRRYAAYPVPAIGVVVWRGMETLIIRRGKPPGEGRWGLIGGAQEWGETHFQAAVREAQEEANIVIEPFSIITAIDGQTQDASGKLEFHYSIIEVNARLVSGEARAQSDIRDVRWVSMPELEKMGVWSEMLRVVKMAEMQYKKLT
jgi:ADP-ribose pyrophosphatase YjhB (NUDIX family)